MSKDEQIFKLWKLLDDIDTLDDAAKDNDKVFRQRAYKIQRKRFDVVDDFTVNALYDKFYPAQTNDTESMGGEPE